MHTSHLDFSCSDYSLAHIATTTLSNTETIVLGVLARQPASGYDLRAWLERTGIFLGYRASLSPIYRTLANLQGQGYLEHSVQVRPNGPDAKVYRLTETGRSALLAWARSPFTPAPRPMDPDFLLRFTLAGQFSRTLAARILRAELEYRLKQKADGEPAINHPTDPVPELDPDWCAEVQRLAHERGYASTAAYIAWLELTLARLEH